MRIVFDTNVIIAGLVAEGLCREIVEVHLPEHEPILSEVLWAELLEVLKRKFKLLPRELPFLDLYQRHATFVEPVALPAPASRDHDDDWVLATALAGHAELVVTGDEDLLVLRAYENMRIQSPREFIARSFRPRIQPS